MPDAELVVPQKGVGEMLLVDRIDNRAFLEELVESMHDELPEPKRGARRRRPSFGGQE